MAVGRLPFEQASLVSMGIHQDNMDLFVLYGCLFFVKKSQRNVSLLGDSPIAKEGSIE
jgi:hypothetical protein